MSFTTDEQNPCKKPLLLSVKKPTKLVFCLIYLRFLPLQSVEVGLQRCQKAFGGLQTNTQRGAANYSNTDSMLSTVRQKGIRADQGAQGNLWNTFGLCKCLFNMVAIK